MKSAPLKHILVFCVLLSGFPILFNEIALYLFKDASIPGAMMYFLSVALAWSFSIGFGIFFIVRMWRQKVFSAKTFSLGLVITIGTYALTFITYQYRPLLNPVHFELLLLCTALLLPAMIMIGAIWLKNRTNSALVTVLLCCLLMGIAGYALFATSKNFTYTYEEDELLGRIRQAPYTYYLPNSDTVSPDQLTFFYGNVNFKEGVSLSIDDENDEETMPTHVNIEERPRHIGDISKACGTEIKTTYLSDIVQPQSYKCRPIAESSNGPIYEVGYDVSSENFRQAGEHIKEYLLATKDTYVFATYQTISSEQPRVYDQNRSVTLLQAMEPVTPQEFFNRLKK